MFISFYSNLSNNSILTNYIYKIKKQHFPISQQYTGILRTIQTIMSHKIKFKIISFSSQQTQYPVSSLHVPGSEGWQSKRFCNYPQQVTLQFYGVANISKIQIIADTRKIPSSADLLFYDPTENALESRFVKYGSLEFSRNQSGRIHEQKTVMVDMKCLYLRLLFHRPFKNKQNFFSQVCIHQVTVYGGQTNISSLGMEDMTKRSSDPLVNSKAINTQEDKFIYEKLLQIQTKKQQAIEMQDYDEAQRLKQIMINIKKLSYIIKDLNDKKQQAAMKEDFEQAKRIKGGIEKTKMEIQQLLSDDLVAQQDYQDQENENGDEDNDIVDHDVQGNQFVGLQINKMLHKDNIEDSRVSRRSQKNSRIKNNSGMMRKSKIQAYDERVIPTMDKRLKTQEIPQFQDKNQDANPKFQAEQIDGKYVADAQMMEPYFNEEIIKKFFSKHWQLKQQALLEIIKTAQKGQQDAMLIKCVLRIVVNSVSETNFKVSLQALNLLAQVIKMNSTTHKLHRTAQLHNDLDKILAEIIKKMSDNNHKIKTASQALFQDMVGSSLYGVEICCNALMKTKSKVKLANKQQVQRLKSLSTIVGNYGLGANGASHGVIDYGVDKLNNPGIQVRNQAIILLATCANIQQKAVHQRLQNIKGTFLQQVQHKRQQLKGNSNPKKKK